MGCSLLILTDQPQSPATREGIGGLGYDVRWYSRASAALGAAVNWPPDLILIDSQSNVLDGLQICRSLRSEAETAQLPVVVLCGSASAEDRLKLLEAGADDCWTEPLDSRECLLRLQALARRMERSATTNVLRYADVQLDLDRHKVKRAGTTIDLTPMQMKLLRHFMENPTIVFSRQQLLERLWDNADVDEGAVTACVIRLRRALNVAGPNLIRIVPSSGYALESETDAPPAHN